MTHPGTALIDAVANAGEVHDSDDDLQNAVERHHDVADPIHEVHQGHPVEIRIVPGLLGRKDLQRAKDSRNHQREEARIHPILVLAGSDEPENRDREEQSRRVSAG